VAIYGFRGLGWFGCGVAVALGCYMVTSQGAFEHARLASLDANIARAEKDIRSLETEFNARANMLQLQRWNGDSLALAAPTAQQYLASETALADLDHMDVPQQTAEAVIPAAVPQPKLEPAVATADAAPSKHGASGVAQADGQRRLRTEAVAMLDKGPLSAATIDDLMKRAQAEQSALR
jgi:hypothetical protein